MTLTTKQKQQFKGKAHKLNPVVFIGNKGLSAAVLKEVERALSDHELIKIRIQGEDRNARKEILNTLAMQSHAENIQLIGNIGVLYRKNNK